MNTTNQNLAKRNKKPTIFLTDHARKRCDQAEVSVKYIYDSISQIPYFLPGEMSWRTSKGVIILRKKEEGKIIVKTFIASFKYKGKNFHKGVIIKK